MTEREALRLLHLEQGCSQDQLRRAYLDLVKVWHPDRFQGDAQLRAKAERTLQSINEAYALLQRRPTGAASEAAADTERQSEPAIPRPDSRAAAAASPPQTAGGQAIGRRPAAGVRGRPAGRPGGRQRAGVCAKRHRS